MDPILVVDDDEDLLEYLQARIEGLGEKVMTAKSGTEALGIIKRKKPSLVLLDWMMPGQDGIKTLKNIKAQWPDLPVIMVTAVSSEKERQKALMAGASDYITKPIDFDQFIETGERNKTILQGGNCANWTLIIVVLDGATVG